MVTHGQLIGALTKDWVCGVHIELKKLKTRINLT
jgi:hypothetical protein